MSKFGFDTAPHKLSLVTRSTVEEHPALADTPLDHALRYADLGWYVIPVRRDKKPADGHGLNSATKDPALIRKIWQANPDAGIAIACERSGLVVLDIDPRNGGLDSLAQLEAEHGIIYSAVVSQTQGGGEHRVFKAHPDAAYPGTLGAGLDLKHRGYILVEPSRGESGVYKWASGKNPTQGSLPTDAPALFSSKSPASAALSVVVRAGSVVVAPEVYADLERALRVIPPESDYATWFRVLQGLSRLADKPRAYALAKAWSLRSAKPAHTEAAFNDKWRTCMREDYAVGHASVFYLADQHAPAWRNGGSGDITTPATQHTVATIDTFKLTPLTLEEVSAARLSPRVVLPFMLYADVRTRISAGGTGKTTLALFEAACLALGRELWGRAPERPMRTVLVTREDARETLAARLREIMGALRLGPDAVEQVLQNVLIMDLSGVSYRISQVAGDVVQPHGGNLEWLVGRLRAFRPDWLIMDPLVSFGVGEQRVNDAEQGLIEAMRILKNEFDCCVEGIHHSGKANAREKTLDQYSGRGGSALADGARMVCVMQPLSPAEWLEATGEPLEEGASALVMAMPKMSYCRAQDNIYIRRRGYAFEHVAAVRAPAASEVEKDQEQRVLALIKDAWLRNTPLTHQALREDFKALTYGALTRAQTLETLGRLKRDGRVVQNAARGGGGGKSNRATLEPVFVNDDEKSKYALPSEPSETQREDFAGLRKGTPG